MKEPILTALLDCLVQRGAITRAEKRDMLKSTDVDFLWTEVGPILDRLEDGYYDMSAEAMNWRAAR
jgi:hypothetical protein